MINIKQKMKKLIIILIFMIIFTLSLIFHSFFNNFFINLFSNKFNVISNKNNMLVHFIDVGQADASAINLPDGKIMLIDTGCEDVNTTYIKYLKENVVNSKMNNYIDYLVLSHADMDHVGGTMKLLKNFKVGTIYMPKIKSASDSYIEILNYVENYCNFVILGEEFEIVTSKYSIMFFKILNELNTNDSSQVIKVESCNKSFLFVGDISSDVESDYIEKYSTELDVDVLKVSHHGSNSSTSNEFLNATTPEYAVVSVGLGNNYGHPSYDVLQRLKVNGVNVLRTDKDNNILFAVGEEYDLVQLSGTYYITNISLNYAYLVAVVDVVLVFSCVMVIFKKEKKK